MTDESYSSLKQMEIAYMIFCIVTDIHILGPLRPLVGKEISDIRDVCSPLFRPTILIHFQVPKRISVSV